MLYICYIYGESHICSRNGNFKHKKVQRSSVFETYSLTTQTYTFLVPESIRLDIAEKIQKIHTNQKENLIIVRYKPQKCLQKSFVKEFLLKKFKEPF